MSLWYIRLGIVFTIYILLTIEAHSLDFVDAFREIDILKLKGFILMSHCSFIQKE